MRSLLLVLAVLATGQTLAAGPITPAPECAAPLPPARMSYRLIDDGRERGAATAALQVLEDGNWHYEVISRGRAGLITVTSTEASSFEWVEGAPRPLSYHRETRAGPFKRRSTASFDWERGVATGEHRGDSWEVALEPGMLDRLLLQLASARLIGAGAEAVDLAYLDRGRIRELDAPRLPEESVTTDGGQQWSTVRVDRVRGSRVTRTWHAQELGLLPVRMEHHDPDDDELWVLELTAVEWLPCPRPLTVMSATADAGSRR